MAARLRRVKESGDRAENDDDAGAQKRKHRNQNDAEDGQNQGVFDQGLALLAEPSRRGSRRNGLADDNHFRGLARNHLKKIYLNGLASTMKEISNDEIGPEEVGQEI